jgi:hypothetical protein
VTLILRYRAHAMWLDFGSSDFWQLERVKGLPIVNKEAGSIFYGTKIPAGK